MADLFKKLNTLVQAKVRDAISLTPGNVLPKLDRRLEKDVERLRERINEAVAHEETLQAKVDALKDEVSHIDQLADEAVDSGQEEKARQLIQRLIETQRRLEFAEADLRQHRLVAQDLIRQVNMMEAAVADALRDEASPQEQDSSTTDSEGALNRFNEVINLAQESMNRLRNKESVPVEQDDLLDQIDSVVGEADVEADIEARRQRLSGPPKQSE